MNCLIVLIHYPLNLNKKEATILYKRLLEIEKRVINYTRPYGNKELLLLYVNYHWKNML